MRILINVADGIGIVEAVEAVKRVLEAGLVSGKGTARGLQHCYHTAFWDGLSVSCVKTPSGSERFDVWRREE